MSKCIHLEEQWDSITEACMAAWLHEAKALGYVDDFYCQVEFVLSAGVAHTVRKQLKTKVKLVERTLLQPARYTADFVVALTRACVVDRFREAGLLVAGASGERNIYSTNDSAIYVVDVKGERCPATQAGKFSLTQKFLHETTGVYVNKLVPCARKARAKAKSFFMVCGLPSELPQECYLNDGSDFRQPWRDMFSGLKGIEEVLDEG